LRLYKLQHVLAKSPPYSKKVYHEKEKNSNSIHRNEAKTFSRLPTVISTLYHARGALWYECLTQKMTAAIIIMAATTITITTETSHFLTSNSFPGV